MQKSKIRTILGLVLLYTAILLNWQWVWGVLLLFWVVPDIISGITYFIEPIERKTNPFLYWAIILSWIWMSIYIIAMAILPQINIQALPDSQLTKFVGVYKDVPLIPQRQINTKLDQNENSLTIKQQTKSKGISAPANPKDTLQYKTYQQEESNFFIGVSAMFNSNAADLKNHTRQLWEYFYENDISKAISNIVDERVYFIYSSVDKKGDYKATIAYRTENVDKVNEGLEAVVIPPTKFAVFEQKNNYDENFIIDSWSKIYESNLDTSDGFNMEVYELDKEYNIEKAEIRVAIK